jgi:hypothetical protein
MAPHVPTAIAAMVANLGVTIPPSGKFKRRALLGDLRRRRVPNGQIFFLFGGELDSANLLIDDRHFPKGSA